MVTDIIKNNALVLNAEIEWFMKILDARIKLHFGHECKYKSVTEIEPPELNKDESMYGNFVNHYQLTFSERVIFFLSLIPHIKPEILDVFFTQNASNSRDFTEFGRRNGHSYSGFIPTGETALFILAGDDLEQRLNYYEIFDVEHFFHRHSILTLEKTNEIEPELNGFLTLSKEIIDLVTTGHIRKPMFGVDFPARKIETHLEWEDLVLDPGTMDQVLEIKAWIDYGDILLIDFELGKKIKPGYRSLFYGASGTGKTFTATLLGKATGHEVYRIDLSLVVSKYIGETEKNLEKIFQKAENKNWILFFDEADALFGKRTSVHDAHDRFANQEISYLLQRVEDYTGVVILASNLRSNIDDAFSRRFQSIIHFPMPKQGERLRLWKNGFSPKTTFESMINLNEIAAKWEMSGGAIMNVVRYATLMALKRNSTTIILNDIQDGIKKEYQKQGKTG